MERILSQAVYAANQLYGEELLAVSRDRVHVDLTLAQVYSDLGRPDDAERALERVAERSPQLAERYSYLAQRPDGDGSRASQAAAGPQVLWAADLDDESVER
ncbi:MAG: tetratricopeptide repeat protein [Alkalispirochaeta sp.]